MLSVLDANDRVDGGLWLTAENWRLKLEPCASMGKGELLPRIVGKVRCLNATDDPTPLLPKDPSPRLLRRAAEKRPTLMSLLPAWFLTRGGRKPESDLCKAMNGTELKGGGTPTRCRQARP